MYPGHATISTTPSPLPIFSILDRAGEAHSATTASAVSRKLPDKRSLRHDITSPYYGFPAGKHPSYPRRRPNDWSTVGDQNRLLAPEAVLGGEKEAALGRGIGVIGVPGIDGCLP